MAKLVKNLKVTLFYLLELTILKFEIEIVM